jgi:anthranilate synthase component 1
MTPEQFKQLAEGNYNRIPLMREVLADMDTPLSAYKKLADEPYSYLFESVHGGEKWGRYSIIGLGSSTILRVSGHQLSIEEDGQIVKEEVVEDPLQAVESYHQQFRVPEIAGMPRFSGGLVGYFGYDCVRYIETRLNDADMNAAEKDDPLECPDILLMVSEQLVVFDNLNGKLHIIVHANPEQSDAYDNAQKQLDALAKKLTVALADSPNENTRHVDEKDFVSGFTQEGFQQGVDRIK